MVAVVFSCSASDGDKTTGPNTGNTQAAAGPRHKKYVRIIALADPFRTDHWMPSKKRCGTDYTAQDILEMIEDLKPDCLERFITGYQDPNEYVPVRKGHRKMTVLEFLNAAIKAGNEGCHIIPKLNLSWLGWGEGARAFFWKSAEELAKLPLDTPITNINLDCWDDYCENIHKTPEERAELFSRLKQLGYKEIGVNMTGNYKTNEPLMDYADFNIDKSNWTVKKETVDRLRAFPNIKDLYLYIDYPGAMRAFVDQHTPDQQADIYTNVIWPGQEKYGFTFVYAVIQDFWDAKAHVTNADGPYKGKSMYDITKELLNRE